MELVVADPSLVVLVGAAGSGKSTFAARRFRAHDVVSSGHCRELVAGDAADQAATGSAFSLLAVLLDKRLRRRLLTVVDATNVTGRERRRLVDQARRYELPAVAVVLDLPLAVCQGRNARRVGRRVDVAVVARQHEQLRAGLPRLLDEGFAAVHVLRVPGEVDRTAVVRTAPDGPVPDGPFPTVRFPTVRFPTGRSLTAGPPPRATPHAAGPPHSSISTASTSSPWAGSAGSCPCSPAASTSSRSPRVRPHATGCRSGSTTRGSSSRPCSSRRPAPGSAAATPSGDCSPPRCSARGSRSPA